MERQSFDLEKLNYYSKEVYSYTCMYTINFNLIRKSFKFNPRIILE